jgi:hypothetical protein
LDHEKILIDPLETKNKKFNFELEEKLVHHSDVNSGGESDGDDIKAQKPYLSPLNDPSRPPIDRKVILSWEMKYTNILT